MSFKSILVVLEGLDREAAVLATALQVARAFDAHLEVLHVRSDPNEVFSFMSEPMSETAVELVVNAAEKGSAELAAKARGQFDAFCQANDIAVAQSAPAGGGVFAIWREETGMQGDVAAHRGRLADLTVVALPTADSPAPVMLEAALLETGKPVLVAPAEKRNTLGVNVVIAWNGGSEAASAVRQARGFLPVAEKIEVVIVSDDEKNGKVEVARPIAYLAYHGIKAEARVITGKARGSGETLMAYAEEQGADLLIMYHPQAAMATKRTILQLMDGIG